MKRLLIRLIQYFTTIKYEIGFFDASEAPKSDSIVSKKIHWLRYPAGKRKSWFADPFILSIKGNHIQVLAEEYSYEYKIGSIALLDIIRDKNEYTLYDSTTILSLSTHLSFPYIFEEAGVTYLCPENYQSGGVSIYKYDPDTKQMNFINQIIDDPLVDVQIFSHNGEYYAMGVKTYTGSMDETKELSIYHSKTLCDKYSLVQTIINEKKEERGAGQIWRENDYYVRPAQCCEFQYGSMLIFYRLNIIDGKIIERELYRYKPSYYSKNGLSLHTYNKLNALCVVDGHDYKNVRLASRLIAPLIQRLRGKR